MKATKSFAMHICGFFQALQLCKFSPNFNAPQVTDEKLYLSSIIAKFSIILYNSKAIIATKKNSYAYVCNFSNPKTKY